MQALLLAGDSALASSLSCLAAEAGFHCISYSDPLRAIDNALDIGPDIFIIDADSFPHHCALAAGMMAALPSSRHFPVLRILSGKAEQSGIGAGMDGLLFDPAGGRESAERLFAYLASMSAGESRTGRAVLRFRNGSADSPRLVVLHPRRLIPMSFSVRSLSACGLQAVPDNSDLSAELFRGELLPDCAMSLGGKTMHFGVILECAHSPMNLVFESMNRDDRSEIMAYIDNSVNNNPFHLLLKP